MDLKTWYENIGGDYQDVLKRLKDDNRIIKFLKLFPQDNSFNELLKAFESSNWKDAFRCAHTLKGLSLTLGLTELSTSSSLLTDSLRNGYEEGLSDIYLEEVKNSYNKVINSLSLII